MTKHLFIVLLSMIAWSSCAYAQEKTDHSSHENMTQDDHSEHSDHNMDHSDHSEHADHDMDHSAHGHGGHDHSDMAHGDEHTGHHGDHHDHGDGHVMDDEGGHIMGQNFDKLPSGCTSISEEIEITVRAGRQYSKKFPGTAFAFDKQEWRVKPCSKITWRFVNEDNIRHQFMMHGLPRYLYPLGMFHLENTGPREISGTMIVPAADATYLVHCDIAQHMEKGMKAQLVVGRGGKNIPSIPGLTPYVINDKYESENLPQVSDKLTDNGKNSITKPITDFFSDTVPFSGMTLIGLLFGIICVPLFTRIIALRKKEATKAP